MKKYNKIVAPLIAVFLGLLVGTLLLVLTGKDPVLMYTALIKSCTGFDILNPGPINLRLPGEFIVSSMPIILTGCAIGFAYRTGLFNIGAEGQVVAGALGASIVAVCFELPPGIHLVACLISGALFGAFWAFIPGILKVKCNISEVVTGIMLNYVALNMSNMIIKMLPGSDLTKTVGFPQSAVLKSSFLSSITNNSRLHWGIIVVVIVLIAYYLIIEKTSFGYSLRATGFNREGARYAGMRVDRNVVYAMMISGAMAGLAGAILAMGTFGYGRVLSANENYGFDGIAVALVGGCNAIGILLAGLLFGLLKVVQPALQTLSIPKDIGSIISSTIIMFVGMQYGVIMLVNKITLMRAKKKNDDSEKGSDV